MDKKTKTIVIASVIGVLLIVVIYINFFAGSSADVPSEAVQAAEETARQHGDQPVNADGVPLDAVPIPGHAPGKRGGGGGSR